ncbi:MAG: hypothetical protein Ct9H300mP23_09170 [Nitrospinota bacterium]|nr:MAG: hypothetical protein Ct9H300mP23_09170 [Nitrospinota bacterium]
MDSFFFWVGLGAAIYPQAIQRFMLPKIPDSKALIGNNGFHAFVPALFP